MVFARKKVLTVTVRL